MQRRHSRDAGQHAAAATDRGRYVEARASGDRDKRYAETLDLPV